MGISGTFLRRSVSWSPGFVGETRTLLSDDVHRDPVQSVHHMVLEADGRQEGGDRLAWTSPKQPLGKEGITLPELSAKWTFVVEALEKDGVKVINPDHALEGALSIRCVSSYHRRRRAVASVPMNMFEWIQQTHMFLVDGTECLLAEATIYASVLFVSVFEANVSTNRQGGYKAVMRPPRAPWLPPDATPRPQAMLWLMGEAHQVVFFL